MPASRLTFVRPLALTILTPSTARQPAGCLDASASSLRSWPSVPVPEHRCLHHLADALASARDCSRWRCSARLADLRAPRSSPAIRHHRPVSSQAHPVPEATAALARLARGP
jgi:hypothetical protein